MLAVRYEEDDADIPGPRHSEAAEDTGPHGGKCPRRGVRPVRDPRAREPPVADVRVMGAVRWQSGVGSCEILGRGRYFGPEKLVGFIFFFF